MAPGGVREALRLSSCCYLRAVKRDGDGMIEFYRYWDRSETAAAIAV